MSFTNWFRGSTPLQLAIARSLKPGGNLAKELDELDDYTVKSEDDAKAICTALEAADENWLTRLKRDKSPLSILARLFQDTEGGSDACEHLREHGTPLLIKLARKALADPGFDQSDLLFVLKMLAAYGTTEGADLVIEIAKTGFASDKFLWSVVLAMFSKEHPESQRVFDQLSDPLPEQFLAVSLLDAANRFLIEGGEARHPYDSDQGVKQLETWLKDTNSDYFSYAVSASAALPFIQHQRQNELFKTAFGHPDLRVQLQAAWAAAKAERAGGLEKMVELCMNVNLSSQAKAYLKELNREDAVPKESELPEFVAKAEFAQWLAHPNELGCFPDELEIVDHRDLRWPVDGELKHFWLIKYRLKNTTGLAPDDIGVGLVGSMTFCLFSYKLEQRHPEDGYAVHCYWELSRRGEIAEGSPKGPTEYATLLQQWNGPRLDSPEVIAVSELNPGVQRARRLVGVASANIGGRPGWAVLDGPDSRWYAADELPEEESGKSILMVHVGRRLLGFKLEPDRKRFLQKPAGLPPEQIKRAYEKLLSAAENGPPSRRKQLIGNHGLLSSHFDGYIEASCSLKGGSKNRQVAETYERILKIARQHPDEADDLLDNWAALGKEFDQYVQALIELGRQQEVIPLVELFAPHWRHNLGYGMLSGAAFKAGRDDIAEKFCLQLKEGLEDWQRSGEMSYLAEIWHRQGKTEDARSLLVECMRKMLEQACEADGSDRKFFEKHFQSHRKTFLKLFPSEQLDQYGLPDTTLL